MPDETLFGSHLLYQLDQLHPYEDVRSTAPIIRAAILVSWCTHSAKQGFIYPSHCKKSLSRPSLIVRSTSSPKLNSIVQRPANPESFIMGIDHGGFAVPTGIFEEAKAFYLAALEPLGYSVQYSYGPYVIGLGDTPHAADFWLAGNDEKGKKRENGKGEHIAFRAKGKAARTSSQNFDLV